LDENRRHRGDHERARRHPHRPRPGCPSVRRAAFGVDTTSHHRAAGRAVHAGTSTAHSEVGTAPAAHRHDDHRTQLAARFPGRSPFQGDLTVGFVDNGLQDIDPQPPATVEHDGRGDVWFTTNGNMLFAVDGARIAEWTGTAGLPDFQTCRERTKTGSTEFSLHPGDILCVRTSEFRTARLVTKVLADPPVPGNLPTFNATVWEPATR
jgi:hypothetical protein